MTDVRFFCHGLSSLRSFIWDEKQTRSPAVLIVRRALERVVVQQFLDEIYVAHEHTAAAVAVKVQRVQRVALRVVRLEKIQVRVPLVTNHLADGDGEK